MCLQINKGNKDHFAGEVCVQASLTKLYINNESIIHKYIYFRMSEEGQ